MSVDRAIRWAGGRGGVDVVRRGLPPRFLIAFLLFPFLGLPDQSAGQPPAESPKSSALGQAASDDGAKKFDSSALIEEWRPGDVSALIGLEIANIQVVGTQSIDPGTVLFKLGLRVGEKLTLTRLQGGLTAVFESGFFDNVAIVGKRDDSKVKLMVVVVEKPALRNVEIVGNHSISKEKLLKLIELEPEALVKPKALQKAAEKIRGEYVKNGYYYVTVRPVIQAIYDEESRVVFEVDEGNKIRIEKIEFVGNESFPAGNRFRGLKGKLKKTREHWFFSFLSKAGKFTPEGLEEDLVALKEFYVNKGFLEVKIGEPKLTILDDKRREKWIAKGKSPEKIKELPKRLHLLMPLQEGPRYRVGKLAVAGNEVFKDEVVLRALARPSKERAIQKGILTKKEKVLREGDWFSLEALRTAMSNIQDLYGNAGYIYANVYPKRTLDRENHIVDIEFTVSEDRVAYVRSIEFEGNTRTRDKVLRRELRILEGDVFKSSLFRYSLSRIQALGYITELVPDVQPTENRRDLDIKIKLNDTRQTEFQFGGGFRSVDGFFGTLSIAERNFLGYGQNVSLSVSASQRSQNYDFSFSEPYLFDSRYAVGANLFRFERSPTTYRNFREKRTGARLTFGRHLFERFQARMSYGYQVTSLSEFDSNEANLNLLELEGISSTSSVTFSASRNTLNNARDPSLGSSTYLSTELAGYVLGGDNNYFKVQAQTVRYFPVAGKLTFAIRARAGYAGSFRGHSLPFFERYRLGGERSIRGFENYSVGPLNQNGDNLGGNKELLLNTEFIVPIADPLRLVLFFDAGNVYSEDEPYDLVDMRKSAGIEVRFFIPQFWVPIRFIWGWKLDKKDNEDPSDFTFSIGTTF